MVILVCVKLEIKPTTTPIVPSECPYPCSAHQLLSVCPSHYTESPWRQNYGFLAIYAEDLELYMMHR